MRGIFLLSKKIFFNFRTFFKSMNINIALIIFNLAKIFLLRLFKMKKNHNTPGLNRGLTSNHHCLRGANYMKFTEEYVIFKEKH